MSRLVWSSANIQSINPVLISDLVQLAVDNGWEFALATHPAHDGKPVHQHLCFNFPSQLSCDFLRKMCMDRDKHSYSAPCRSFRRCVRYLLHLDNPDKDSIPRSSLISNLPEEILSDYLLTSSNYKIIPDLIRENKPDSPLAVFDLLVSNGFHPREISAYVNALSACSDLFYRGERLRQSPRVK